MAALPEEIVRQKWLGVLLDTLEFPIEYLAVEVPLNQLPHLVHSQLLIPKRRLDIVCFAKADPSSDCSLYPLLILECKAETLNEKAYQQVMGYQRFAKGCFLGLCNEAHVRVGFYDKNASKWRFTDTIPNYKELVHFKH